MAQSLNTPDVLTQPIAQNGDKNTIPNTNDQSLGQMSQSTGFPAICSERIADGGKAPRRADFNGAFYLISQQHFFYQNGGTNTFRQDVSNAIGGYPLNARLFYTDANGNSVIVRSNKANNTDNFVSNPSYIGDSWIPESPALSWDNTWTGVNVFQNGASLGDSSTATTQPSSDSSTKLATTEFIKNILSAIYPVGSLYIGTQNTCPMASLISGSTWTLVAKDKALWTGDGTNGNTTIPAGLPNITGTFGGLRSWDFGNPTGAFTTDSDHRGPDGSDSRTGRIFSFNASNSNSIYGSSTTVQPPAYRVNVWRRTA